MGGGTGYGVEEAEGSARIGRVLVGVAVADGGRGVRVAVEVAEGIGVREGVTVGEGVMVFVANALSGSEPRCSSATKLSR